MKRNPRIHFKCRLSAAAALLMTVAIANQAGAQQFYDHGRQWQHGRTIKNGLVPDDYYHPIPVEGDITRSTPPFGYYAAPRPTYKIYSKVYANDPYANNASLNVMSRELNRPPTRQHTQLDANGHTMAYLNGMGGPENADATALPADTVYTYESTDLHGVLQPSQLPQTRQTVSAKRIIRTSSGDNLIQGGGGTQYQMNGRGRY